MPGYLLLSWEEWGRVVVLLQSYPLLYWHLTSWRHPMLQTRRISCAEEKTLSFHISASTYSLSQCRETSVWHLVHYHWDGRWWIRQVLEQRVGCFCTSFLLVRHCWSDYRAHQRRVYDCWQGRRCIVWRIGLWLLAICLYPYNQMVCNVLSSPKGYYSGDFRSTPCLGVQLWVGWSITHQLG